MILETGETDIDLLIQTNRAARTSFCKTGISLRILQCQQVETRLLSVVFYWVSKKKFTHLACYGIKSIWLTFKTKMLTFQSKTNFDESILFGKITRHLDPEIRKMLEQGYVWG